jgi:hypothetical protein
MLILKEGEAGCTMRDHPPSPCAFIEVPRVVLYIATSKSPVKSRHDQQRGGGGVEKGVKIKSKSLIRRALF